MRTMAKRCLIYTLIFVAVFQIDHVIISINLISDHINLFEMNEKETATLKPIENNASTTDNKDGTTLNSKLEYENTSKILLNLLVSEIKETTTSHISTGIGLVKDLSSYNMSSWDSEFNVRADSNELIIFSTNKSKKENQTNAIFLLESICKDWMCAANTCYCDANCLLFHDCCFDVFNSTFRLENISDIITAISNPIEFLREYNIDISRDEILLQNYSSCHSINIMYEKNLLVVDRCPKTFKGPNLIKEFCEEMDENDIRNVYVSQNTGAHIIYRNMFCAFCHQLNIKQFSFWKVEVRCPIGILANESTLIEIKSSCNLSFEIPTYLKPARKCFQEFISVRELYHGILSTLCSTFYGPIKFNGKTYKNRFCLSIAETGNTTDAKCIDGPKSIFPEHDPGYHLLFAITDEGLSLNGMKIAFMCDVDHVYDILAQTCKPLSCLIGSVLIEGTCIPSKHFNNSFNLPFENGLSNAYTYYLEFSLSAFTNLSENTTENDELSIRKILDFVDICNEYNVPSRGSLILNSTSFNKTHLWTTVLNVTSPGNLSLLLSCLQNITGNDTDLKGVKIRNYVNKTNLSCPKQILKQVDSIENISFYNDAAIVLLDFDKSIDLFFTRFEMTLRQDNGQIDVLYFCLPSRVQLNCSQIITYNSEEFSYENDTLKILNGTVSAKSFHIEQGKLFICVSEEPKDRYINDVIDILMYSCSSLSILALLVLILIHAALPSLMTIHGKNLVSLSFSSLVAHVLFLTCRFSPRAIQDVLTIFNHFFWLSTFLWMNIIATDIGRKFFAKNMLVQRTGNDKQRFRLYCLVGWGLPAAVVVVCAVLDQSIEHGMIGYNSDKMCWISNRTARLYAFFIPVLLTFISSMICYCVAMYGIVTSQRAAISVIKQSNNRNMCLIYTKLTIILGITWSLEFVSSNVDFTLLSYISIILNGLQGFFICFISICNQKTMKAVRMKTTKSARKTKLTFSTV